jgi:DNA-directed RNA polymerase omega subunit
MMQKLPEGVDSTFRYILIAAKRAEQLIAGARPRVAGRHAKPATIALSEVIEGKVPWQALTAEEYEQLREQQLQGATAEEDAAAVFALPRPVLPPAEPEPEEEEAGDFAEEDLDDADFDEDLDDVSEDVDESAEGESDDEEGSGV